MKVTNLRSLPMIIGEKTVNPGDKITMKDDQLDSIQHLLDQGLIKIENVKIKEGEHGKTV